MLQSRGEVVAAPGAVKSETHLFQPWKEAFEGSVRRWVRTSMDAASRTPDKTAKEHSLNDFLTD
jgi:hypothetical protein